MKNICTLIQISPCSQRVTPNVEVLLANPLLYPLVEKERV